MYSKSFLERYSNCWQDGFYENLCFGIHPAFIEEGKQTEIEEDEDD